MGDGGYSPVIVLMANVSIDWSPKVVRAGPEVSGARSIMTLSLAGRQAAGSLTWDGL